MTGRGCSREAATAFASIPGELIRAPSMHTPTRSARASPRPRLTAGTGDGVAVGNAPNNKIRHNTAQFSFIEWFSRSIVDQDDLNVGRVDATLHKWRERPDRSRQFASHIVADDHHRDLWATFGQSWRFVRLAGACWLNLLMRSTKTLRQATDCPSRPTPFSAYFLDGLQNPPKVWARRIDRVAPRYDLGRWARTAHGFANDLIVTVPKHAVLRIKACDQEQSGRRCINRKQEQVASEPLQYVGYPPDIACPDLACSDTVRLQRMIGKHIVENNDCAWRRESLDIHEVAQRIFKQVHPINEG